MSFMILNGSRYSIIVDYRLKLLIANLLETASSSGLGIHQTSSLNINLLIRSNHLVVYVAQEINSIY